MGLPLELAIIAPSCMQLRFHERAVDTLVIDHVEKPTEN
jgi:hypothetical protein